MDKGKVSIIIPIYNDEKYIRHCVDSVINQTYKNLEIILVDDASNDSSLKICREYAATDSRVMVLHNVENLGLSGSRENGYMHATGEWIGFLDHDDCMNPCAIELLINCADAQTDIIAAKYKNIITSVFEQYQWDNSGEAKVIALEHDAVVDTLGAFGRYEVPECLWGKIYRKHLFEKTEITRYKKQFSMVYFEDVLLTPSLFKTCSRMKIINRYVYIHRIDYNSVSMSPNALEFNLQTARTVDIVTGWLGEPYCENAYARVMQNYLLVFSKNWYLVWQYHNKDAKLLQEMEALFDRYYKIYRKLKNKGGLVPDICIRVFRLNKVLFCLVVCKLWFQFVSKVKYRLQSR